MAYESYYAHKARLAKPLGWKKFILIHLIGYIVIPSLVVWVMSGFR